MHRFVLIYVGAAAFLTAWAVTEAQYRVVHLGYLLIPEPYLPLLRVAALGLWITAVLALAAKQNRDAAAHYQDLQTGHIQASNRYLVEAVTLLADAVLADVDQKKHAEIKEMLDEYGIDTNSEPRNGNAIQPRKRDRQNLIKFRQSQRSTGDR